MYRRMHVLVEGRDDRELFNAVIRPILQEQYDHVQTWEYAGATVGKRVNYIRSVQAMNADYLFMADINTSPCITARKEHLIGSHKRMIDSARMIIVRREIESWYMAGVGSEACQELGIADMSHTDELTKEQFEGMLPRRFDSVVDFMSEIIRCFHIETAKTKNRSFCYLMDKLQGGLRKA
jgi:hypothetical protein